MNEPEIATNFNNTRANNENKSYRKKKPNIVILLVKAKALADKYAGTKKRWWVLDKDGEKTGDLKTSNKEADKVAYEEFCKGFEEYLK